MYKNLFALCTRDKAKIIRAIYLNSFKYFVSKNVVPRHSMYDNAGSRAANVAARRVVVRVSRQ